jgi:hypothetical protein
MITFSRNSLYSQSIFDFPAVQEDEEISGSAFMRDPEVG